MKTAIFLWTLFIVTEAGRVPSDIEKCHIKNTKCFEKEFNRVVKKYKNGIPSLGVPTIDPLRINQIKIIDDERTNRPINLNMEFKDFDVIGLSNAIISDVKGFDKVELNKKNKVELKLKGPWLQMTGKYKINGNVLVLPITGAGDSNLQLENYQLTISFTAEGFDKNGKRYVKLGKPFAVIEISKFKCHLDNLFGGDKLLSEQMNSFLNENWRDIYEEIRPAIVDTFGDISNAILNNVLNNVPLDELFYNE